LPIVGTVIGKVIKGEGPRPGVVDGEVYDARQSAQAIVEAAKRQAQELVDAARQESARVFEEAREAGHQQGLAEVSEHVLRAKLLQTEVLQKSEKEIVALACRVAAKILGRDLERDPRLVVELCAHAIESVRSAQQVVVRVNPADAALLREDKRRLMELVGRVKEIALKEDPDVARSGCIIETDAGTLDAQLATQLEMLQNLLLGE
jgi:type III secretion protein L